MTIRLSAPPMPCGGRAYQPDPYKPPECDDKCLWCARYREGTCPGLDDPERAAGAGVEDHCPGSYRSQTTGEYICLGDGRVCEGEAGCTYEADMVAKCNHDEASYER
ncbi:MAG: hypothetical protein JXA57_17785 [Armatimonadetes bacterium]|nr:hypothetical protein [Armatimonadota bacterium]